MVWEYFFYHILCMIFQEKCFSLYILLTDQISREVLLLTFDQQLLDDEEFVLLYDLNTSKNPDYPHWNYDRFDLDNWTYDVCKTDLRFYKSDLYRLANVLNVPEQIKGPNILAFDGIETFFVFLKCFSYPCRHSNLLPRF